MQNYNEKYEEFKYEIISETKDGKLKQLYWNIAFGLQEVDNLKPSKYMIDLATENINGKKTYDDVEKEIKEYYNSCPESKNNPNEQEADIVSVRLVQLLSDNSFRFDYNTYRIYHKYLFNGLDIVLQHYFISRSQFCFCIDTMRNKHIHVFLFYAGRHGVWGGFKIAEAAHFHRFLYPFVVVSVAVKDDTFVGFNCVF